MVGDFFNYMFSKGQYDPNIDKTKTLLTNTSAPDVQQSASLMSQSAQPKFSYINEMKTAQTKREENVNRFLTTPGFIETLNYYRPTEHPEIPGYASTIGGGQYKVLNNLNNLLLNKNKGEILTNLLMSHFANRDDVPEVFGEVVKSFCFTPDSEDPYQYYKDKNSLEGLTETMKNGNKAVIQLREELGSRVTDFTTKENENGYVTEMSVTIDGCTYSVSYDYFEDSGYPLSETKTQTINGETTTKLTCYSYGEGGEHLEDTDINNDGKLDTIINYDDSYNVISYQNLDIRSMETVEPDAALPRNTAVYGGFVIDENSTGKISKTTDDEYVIHVKDKQGNPVDIPMNSQGFIPCEDFYNYMQASRPNDPISEIINPSENTMYRYTDGKQVEKIYLDDNDIVVYDLQGNLVLGEDRARNNNTEILIDEKIGEFNQGSAAGDCWLLSALDALSTTKIGAKLIRDAISDPLIPDNVYKVELGGKKYPVSVDELVQAKNNTKYSRGDDDMLLFELGYEKYLADILAGKMENPYVESETLREKEHLLDGGGFGQVLYALGKDGSQSLSKEYFSYYNEGFKSEQYDYLMRELANYPEDYVATVSFLPENGGKVYGTNSSGEQILLANTFGHGWSIQSIQNGFVTISNPWDTEGKTVTMSIDELRRVAESISFCYIK